jgi:hypothetical protein
LELYGGNDAVLNLRTGEMLVLADASLDDLAEARLALGELWHTRTTAAMMLDAELVRRADEALRTGDDFGHGARFRVFVDRGGALDYNSNALRAALLAKADAGEIELTRDAVDRLFKVSQYRLDLKRWADVVKRWPDLAELGELHSSPKRRGAKIERRDVVESSAVELSARGPGLSEREVAAGMAPHTGNVEVAPVDPPAAAFWRAGT